MPWKQNLENIEKTYLYYYYFFKLMQWTLHIIYKVQKWIYEQFQLH